jgi:hypothetical protein
MVELAGQVLGRADSTDQLRHQVVNQSITIKSAERVYQNAHLTREIAEIAVTEYQEGIFVQDRATAVGEVKLAESDLSRARDLVELAKERLAKIRQASRGSAGDLSLEYTFADRLSMAQLQEQKAKFALEAAESKLKVLLDYTQPKRLKELQAAVEKAHSDELAKQAAWEIEKAKLERLQKAGEPQQLSVGRNRVLALLDQAIPIDEQVRTKLEQLIKNGKPDDPLQKEIRDLTNQLQALLYQAEEEQAAARFDQWKPRIQQAARRAAAPKSR